MKKTSSSLLAAVLLVTACFVPAVQAQQGPAGPRRADPEQRRAQAERVAEHLELSAEQKTRMQEINRAQQEAMQQIRADESLSREQRREKAAAVRENFEQQRRAVLTPDQQGKADAMRAKMKERKADGQGKRRGGPKGGGN